MNFEKVSLSILQEALEKLEDGFNDLPEIDHDVDTNALRAILLETAERMRDNYPYQHPLYAGQMLKPPHPVARLAYMLSLWLNPNNHALDGGRASSAMEKEAVANIAAMFGWDAHLGHLCGGGTMANMEALWVAGRLYPGKKVVASQQAHYTHNRLTEVLHIPFQAIPCDTRAKMDLNALEDVLKQGGVGTVVATLGSTATGSVDPLPDILDLKKRYNFHLHVDAAYGGYFFLANNLASEARTAFDRITDADSIVIDPHKHGLQPYGCGCVLFKDPSVGKFYKHDSPYTYFSSAELHLGEISLECSRAGASAVALWATQKLFPMRKGETFSQGLEKGRKAALDLFHHFQEDTRFLTALPPELDIVIWAPQGKSASEISQRSKAFFEAAAAENLHLAVASFPKTMFEDSWDIDWDEEQISCLRSCLMKAEHLAWVEHIWQILNRVAVRTI
ncbi:aspartate aminotransferase family protein [candidate division KSB3 bacterium]|uniref:Aspartate aminotransferase family protein n=1 Tax=candidate division KSB3 bacterium TaxID=2044937 RepID=A0A2G6KKP1_9BACT|nr:MAG: aspartate aminotransferase family protein [candidate division KSB3 bacterium]